MKKKIKLSKTQWKEMGKKAGWMKQAQVVEYTEQEQLEYDMYDLIDKEKISATEALCRLMSIPCRKYWEICDDCSGHGMKDNPNLHSTTGPGIEGLAAEDPDFMEKYHSGTYDVTCKKCRGSGKVLVSEPIWSKVNPQKKAIYVEAMYTYNSGQDELADEKAMQARGIEF